MYKVIENGMEKMCSAKETEAMIRDFKKIGAWKLVTLVVRGNAPR